jgi:hypothetical protein
MNEEGNGSSSAQMVRGDWDIGDQETQEKGISIESTGYAPKVICYGGIMGHGGTLCPGKRDVSWTNGSNSLQTGSSAKNR